MDVVESHIETSSKEYKANYAHYEKMVNDFVERRVYPRIAFRQQVPLEIEGGPRELTVAGVDLSHGGACLNVPLSAPLAEGSHIQVNLPRPGPDSTASTGQSSLHSAQVVRVDRVSRLLDGLAVVGLQFN